jgi:cytochrome c oxidase accessory protein FixG
MARPSLNVIQKPAAEAAAPVEIQLYAADKKIYPRAVHGWFAAWRWLLVWGTQLVFYGGAWLTWNDRQAVLFDIAHRKFYIFGLVFWPQDVIYLAVLLIVCALSLFLFTAVAGRLWCGYACPQTVYTEIFLWVERRIEGERNQRIRLDREPWDVRKVVLKTAKHAAWLAIALWTGFTFVGYFTPIRDLWMGVATLGAGPWETFWILFYGFATYGNAGWMREQVCTYMCPYARFQSAMFDKDTLIITYDRERGEPRGARARGVASQLGDCVNCGVCVQVCPTGIDIRDGLQYQCIGCAACIDGCDQVMDRVGFPRGLIRYSTQNALEKKLSRAQLVARTFRVRVLVYSAILWAVVIGTVIGLYIRVPLKVDVIRDRSILSREVAGGDIENVYRLMIMNPSESERVFDIEAMGLPTIHVDGETHVKVGATESRLVPLRVRVHVAPGSVAPGQHPIHFLVHAHDDPSVYRLEKTVFMVR